MRRVSVFGATGSIGRNTMELLADAGDDTQCVALTGGHNVALLADQARRFRPEIVVTACEAQLSDLRDALSGTGIETAAGALALEEAADRTADWTMSAIVGAAGIRAGLVSLKHGGTLALANKETMVAAGSLAKKTALQNASVILPVDSEHSALFQLLAGEETSTVEKVTITASGGPFRSTPVANLADITPEQAMKHPNWHMGKRISIDSASMFNKALELIEAQVLFDLETDDVDVVIHPQSLVHALVSFHDGTTTAHLGTPDMRTAIGYALHFPRRVNLPVPGLDIVQAGKLEFLHADPDRWPALRLARDVMDWGEPAGAIFNAAKETALDAFIEKRVGFLEMAIFVEQTLERCHAEGLLDQHTPTIDDILNLDAHARMYTSQAIGQKLAS